VIAICIVLAVLIVIVPAMVFSGRHRSRAEQVRRYDTDNPHILPRPLISAHRAGGGIAPEETMLALKNCAEAGDFTVGMFEFDLHITADGVLVLQHDDTLDRTSDSAAVFGRRGVRPEEKTYAELRRLNMGANFTADDGSLPFAGLAGAAVPEDVRITRLEDALDYLESRGRYVYTIDIKNGGDLGIKAVDLLYGALKARNMVDRVIFGDFHAALLRYARERYPDLTTSTSVGEVFRFWMAALFGFERYRPPCRVLQIPFCRPYLTFGVNLATARVMNFAHRHGMALQYWTVNREADMRYLTAMGADCIMTDRPDLLCRIVNA